jgi:outer membrane protein assembly factor BamB
MKSKSIFILLMTLSCICNAQRMEQIWPQFRGLNGSGIAIATSKPPIAFDEGNLLWKTELPKGVSSPVIWKDKLFITGFVESSKELQTICINRKNGIVLWRNNIKPDTVEKYSTAVGSPAQSTLTTDGERVIAYFGSCGFFCYDFQGKLLWKSAMACNKGTYGSATSPVIAGDKVIFICDVGSIRYLLALNKKNGSLIWKSSLPVPSVQSNTGGHSAPCIYNDKIYVHHLGSVSCFSIKDGSLLFRLPINTEGVSSPLIIGNKVVTACWFNFSEADQRSILPSYDELVKNWDKDQNGKISKAEFPDDMILCQRPEVKELEGGAPTRVKSLWGRFFDQNKDGEIVRDEWNASLEWVKSFYKPSGLVAINLDSRGELSDSSILWRVEDNISEVPSPVFYNNRIYMIKDGGTLTCVNPESGKVIYIARIGIPGSYVSSPVAANGYIYIIANNGRLIVVKAGDTYETAGQYDFKENIGATPAIVENNIYIRTKTQLLAYTNK